MSAAHDAHADASAAHHDAHDHFDNEPATELGADEPRTPGWVPALGLALFAIAGLAWMLSSNEDKPAQDKPAAAAVAAPVQTVAMPQPARPGQPAPGINAVAPPQAGTANPIRQLSPEQAKDIQKQIDALRGMQNNRNPNPDAVPPPGQPAPAARPQPAPAAQPQPVPR